MPKFDNSLFREIINDHGYVVLVEKSNTCSCYDQEHSSARPDCPYCRGTGLVWRPFGTIKAAVTGIKEIKSQMLDATQVSQGDKQVSTLPEHKLAINDRVRFTHTLEIYQETLNIQEEGYYVPYYEIAKIENVLNDRNEQIPLSEVYYDIVNDRIYVSNYTGTISIRYQYYPYYLISELLHSNRQQWTLNAGEGSVEQLPQNFLAKRITTKLKTTFATALPEAGVLVDLRNVNHQFISLDFAAFAENKRFTIEVFQKADNEGEFLKISDVTEDTLNIWAFISSYDDIDTFGRYLEVGDKVVLTRDKYAKDYTFGNVQDNSIMEYLGGDTSDLNNWLIEEPEDGTQAISKFDPSTNQDCEAPVANKILKRYSKKENRWRTSKPEIILSLEGTNQVKTSLDGIEIELSTKYRSGDYLYTSFHIKNCTKIADIYTVLNLSAQSLTGSHFMKGIFSERTAEINNAENLMPLFRIYDRFLDTYEEMSDFHYLMNNIEEPQEPEEPNVEFNRHRGWK